MPKSISAAGLVLIALIFAGCSGAGVASMPSTHSANPSAKVRHGPKEIYVVNSGAGFVTVYDGNGNQITTRGCFCNLDSPVGIAFDSINGELYVTNGVFTGAPGPTQNTMAVFSQVGTRINTSGTFPNLSIARALVFDPANGLLYVANANTNTVTVYDQDGNQVTPSGTFPNLNDPEGITFDPVNGQLYVVNENNNTITVYDQSGNKITPTGTFPNLNVPDGIAFDSANNQLYVANRGSGTVTAYDQNGNQVTTSGTFPNLIVPTDIAFDPANNQLYVTDQNTETVTAYDQNGNQVATNFPTISGVFGIAAAGN